MTAPAFAATTERGSWYPQTKARAEMEAEDARKSEELARQCGLKSYREQHPEEVPGPRLCECGCGAEVPPNMRTPFATRKCRNKYGMRRYREQSGRPTIRGDLRDLSEQALLIRAGLIAEELKRRRAG